MEKPQEINMVEFLSDYASKHIVYIPNPGNAGDSLIAMGTLQLFDKLGLNYVIGDINVEYKDKILFYAGGGNLVGLYNNCYNFLNKNKAKNEIVLLPHTVKDVDSLVTSLGSNVTIICREYVSYVYVYSITKHSQNVLLSKDMAFYITGLESYTIKGVGEGNCFRLDCEKTNVRIPSGNNDISASMEVPHNTTKPDVINNVCSSVFKYLSQFEVINTNRLHVAIAGALLGKRVNLYRNSYYKNKAVYDYSLKDIFNNVSFKSCYN